MDAALKAAAPPAGADAGGAPRDPFDPEVFNRRFGK